ncbi:Hpt domain-containing protein [Alloalcanivorax mobilis]|uniref:Hpt domain-containing protein n=1 Tax=Alloalcanivorax mobilis TaxID=2019569 RepID=UPI000B5B11BB|nr:Hpt domain-containing protein [Alloalcanivorax mobilis]ASK33936.1 hypothetical protein CEK62_05820 [Alcanivorax sp. N3-2A]|tara:strand:- start:54371 stop:56062 length:1692 start_codon:yes stop_codon:yes gene_type:complete
MVAITNTTSLTFLKDAIDTTLGEAEANVEAFAEDQAQPAVLDQCAESFHQLRGISQMLELSAAALLSEEMELACQELKRHGERPLMQALSNAVVLLGRYFEYVQLKDRTLPEMLIGGINELRRAAGKALIQESHFFSVDLSRPRTPPAAPGDHIALARQSRRLRHMYQVGLLGLLRGQNRDAHLRLMARALERVDGLSGAGANSRFWWVARAATETLAVDGLVITPARKALLAQYDRQLKKLIYDGDHALQQEAPLLLIKESLYLTSLGAGSGPAAAEVRAAFALERGASDADLQRELALMTGSRGSVIRSVAGALKDEINQIKETLDLAAQGVADVDYRAVAEGMRRVASTLEMVGKESEAAALRERATQVAGWPADTDVDSGDFHALVDDLLAAENIVASLERSLAPSDDVRRAATNSRISLYQLDEARMTVVGECRAGLALAKRSLAAYMENQWDPMHLSNLPGTFASISGGLMFLELERACQVVKACRAQIEEQLIGASQPPGQPVMETLADALTGIDYYLESMEEQKPIGDGVLDVAEQAVAELGYPVTHDATGSERV